jgi:hypothetical protein
MDIHVEERLIDWIITSSWWENIKHDIYLLLKEEFETK